MKVTEADFQRTVCEALDLFSWKWTHFRPAKTDKGWRTPLSGSAGFVDILATRAGYVLALELKSETGRLRPEQIEWLTELAKVPGVIAAVLRPSGWSWFERVVRDPASAEADGEPRK